MTSLTVTEVYAIGLPIIYGMIALEALFSSISNKSFYRLNDTLCTAGLLVGNILIGFAAKGISFSIHIFLYQFRLIDLASLIPVWAMWVLAFILIDLVFKKLINFFISSSIYQIILSTIFRLFFSILFVFAFILYGVSNEVLFTINFLVVYLLFIIFEITILLLNLHHTK